MGVIASKWYPRVIRGGRLPKGGGRARKRGGLMEIGIVAGLFGIAVYNTPGVSLPWTDRTEHVAPGGGVRVARAERVIDGDTFVALGERIRVADIDTPEVEGRCPAEIALAARATGRMRELLNAGPFELHPLSSGPDEDQYGRKLRIVTRGGRSLGDQLVAEGLARTWSGRREAWC